MVAAGGGSAEVAGGAELALAISSFASSSSMADSSSVSALEAEGGGSGCRPSLTALLISAARQAEYFCFCRVSGACGPNWRRICRAGNEGKKSGMK